MRWILILLLLFLFGLQYRLWMGSGSWEQIVSLDREIKQQTRVNERLSNRNKLLDVEVQDLKNGLESVEERARSDLGLIKEGETFYLMLDEEK